MITKRERIETWRWGPVECAPLDIILEIQKLKSCRGGDHGRENMHLGKGLRLGLAWLWWKRFNLLGREHNHRIGQCHNLSKNKGCINLVSHSQL